MEFSRTPGLKLAGMTDGISSHVWETERGGHTLLDRRGRKGRSRARQPHVLWARSLSTH